MILTQDAISPGSKSESALFSLFLCSSLPSRYVKMEPASAWNWNVGVSEHLWLLRAPTSKDGNVRICTVSHILLGFRLKKNVLDL